MNPMMQQAPLDIYWKLEPKKVWEVFSRIAAVPRPSLREERIRRALQAIAAEQGWETAVDGGGNLVIYVPATPGREDAETLILQAHMDMVCIKREGSKHDFDFDPIHLQVVEHDGKQVVTARDTTLGADNGIGVAAALAVALDEKVAHGPLELLFTTNEETGMTGAKAMDASLLKGRKLLNLDSEEDDAIFAGCVGGGKVEIAWECRPQAPHTNQAYYALFVEGLRGGHSGLEIHQNRGNAIQILARTLAMLPADSFRLCCLDGGERHNAIPHRAAAVIAGDATLWQRIIKASSKMKEQMVAELRENAAGLTITSEPLAGDPPPVLLGAKASHDVMEAIGALEHGVLGRDAKDSNIIETSANVAIATTMERDDVMLINIEISTRSLVQARIEELHSRYEAFAAKHGANFTHEFKYAPWEPDWQSPLLRKGRNVYKDLFGKRPIATTIHGGLECAIIGTKIPGIEMISIGPRIEEPHTPNERVYVESVQKFWLFLSNLVDQLSRP